MYYLNAFNEMLRKRQRQNMMGGEGVGTAPPSGPMGARQSGGGMAGVRNALSNPFVNFAASMIPAARAPFALAKLGVSAYDDSQRASENAAMEAARQGFQAREKADYGPFGPDFSPYPDFLVDPSAYEGAMSINSFPAGSMGGTAPGYVDDSGDRLGFSGPTVGGPIGGSVTGAALDTSGSGLQGGGASNQTGLYGDAGMPGSGYGGGSGAPGANADGYGGGDAGFGGNSQAFNQGGMVTPDRLMGRAPAPDDGYGALQGGEYVITKAAVEKYGKRLLDAINNGTFR